MLVVMHAYFTRHCFDNSLKCLELLARFFSFSQVQRHICSSQTMKAVSPSPFKFRHRDLFMQFENERCAMPVAHTNADNTPFKDAAQSVHKTFEVHRTYNH